MNDELYREQLMEIYKNPQHRGKLDNASVEVVGKNPLCGDELTLQLSIDEGKIGDAKFDGSACAVSIISSTILLDALKGKTLEEAKNISKEDLLGMIGIELSTSRVKCATLILDALKNALDSYEQKN